MVKDARFDLGRYVSNPFNKRGHIPKRLDFNELFVSKAKEDLPDPEGPVITTSLFFLISTLTSFRLCCLAPLIDKIFFIYKIVNLQFSKNWTCFKKGFMLYIWAH